MERIRLSDSATVAAREGNGKVADGPPGQGAAGGGELREWLSEYYGRRIQKTDDLATGACCADDTLLRYPEVLAKIPAEVKEKNYGCGSTLPEDDLHGLRVLDLGSGAGLDAFLAAWLVGESGFVHGVDMTAEQLDVARRNIEPVREAFGFARPNVAFDEGYIETTESIPDASVDLVISDRVINLSPRKDEVFRNAWRVLAPGGELYFSDIVADRRVPAELRDDPEMVAECLGGALYFHDLIDVLEDAGFRDARVVKRQLVEEDVGGVPIRFYSVTVRAFRFDEPLDRRCEDFGQFATYLGTCPRSPPSEVKMARFILDDSHAFEADRPVAVCRNTARMLSETRLGAHFEVSPARRHAGIFPCGPGPDATGDEAPCC